MEFLLLLRPDEAFCAHWRSGGRDIWSVTALPSKIRYIYGSGMPEDITQPGYCMMVWALHAHCVIAIILFSLHLPCAGGKCIGLRLLIKGPFFIPPKMNFLSW